MTQQTNVVRLPQNVTPNRLVEKVSSDGTRDIFYSNKGDKTHGHTVIKDGEILYARTRGQRVV